MRNGVGYLIDESSGTANRESEWENGIETFNSHYLHEGWCVKGMSESIRSILKNENPSKMKSVGYNDKMPFKRIEIHNRTELNALNFKVTDLVICSNSCNDVNE